MLLIDIPACIVIFGPKTGKILCRRILSVSIPPVFDMLFLDQLDPYSEYKLLPLRTLKFKIYAAGLLGLEYACRKPL